VSGLQCGGQPLDHESAAEMLSALLGDEPELESLKR